MPLMVGCEAAVWGGFFGVYLALILKFVIFT